MAIETSDRITDDTRAEKDAADAVMSPAYESAAIRGEQNTSPKSNNAEGVNESDSSSNDQDNCNSDSFAVEMQGKLSSPLSENDNSNICNENEGKNGIKNNNESKDNHQSGSDSDSDDSSTDDGSDSDSDSGSEKQGDGISAYERLRIERIRRNEERLAQLGLVDPNKKRLQEQKKKKRVSLGAGASQQRSKENEVPTRSQPKRSAKKKLLRGELLSSGQINLRRSQPLRQSYKNRFGNRQIQPKAIVEKNRYSKRYRCGECRACKRRTDCQTCCFCSMNQRRTPSSTCRRRCLFRMCLRRLVDVEVDVYGEEEEEVVVETEAEENEKEKTETKALTIDTATNDTDAAPNAVADAGIDNAIDKGANADGLPKDHRSGDSKGGNNIVALEGGTSADAKANGDDEAQEQNSKLPQTDVCDKSAKDSMCAEETSESVKEGEAAPFDEKISIDNSEYFASYRMEEDDIGMPKWLDEFHTFIATVPHGPMNRVSGQKNVDNTMSQICKLVLGEGVTYHLWPEGIQFKKGSKIHLGMDLRVLHEEAITMERTYEDRRKGSLLRHPIAKLVCYKEWIANGKPKAPKEQPMSPLLALPPPTIDSGGSNKEGKNDSKPKKRIVAMTIEDRIKPNRVRWASDTVEISVDVAVERIDTGGNKAVSALATNDAKSLMNESVKDANNGKDDKSADVIKIEPDRTNDDANIAINDAVKNGNKLKSSKLAADGVDTKPDSAVSQGNDKANDRQLLSNSNDETKSSDDTDKDVEATTKNETNSIDVAATKASAGESAATINEIKSSADPQKNASSNVATTNLVNETSNTNKSNVLPSSCAVCTGGGDLICCDGCDRGYHSNCHNPKIKEIPVGDWFCRDCKRKKQQKQPQRPKSSSGPKREVVVNRNLFQGEHDDDCYMCYLGGDLLCCDFCEKAFHLACHIPPLPFIPEGIWKCCECSAVERKKMSRCGECEACTRVDCGKCKHCLDKPKFGGFYRLKQVCIKKACPYPRFAPPASSILVAGAIPMKRSAEPKPLPSTGKKRGRPRKSVDRDNLAIHGSAIKKKRGRPRKLVEGGNLPINGTAIEKKRGRPKKSVDGDNLSINGSLIKKKRGRPRKLVEGDNLPINGSVIKKKRGRPRKSVDGDNLPINGSTIKKKRGRPRKSVENGERHESKRVKIEAADEDIIVESVVFRFKISSFKKAFKDPESIKIRKVIKTALRDPSDSKAVDKACEQLRKCLKSSESVKTAILFGGVEMICDAMRDHLEKSILQAEACCTLAEMLWLFPGISTKLAYMGAVNLIVKSIHNCPNNFKVQQMGCGALGALSYDTNNIQHIMDAGGLWAVITAMERFPKKHAVQKEGCYFLQNLIVRSVHALSAVSSSKVVPIIVEAMSSADSNTEFLLSVCGLIANLAVNKEAKGVVGKSDAIFAVISVLNTTDDVEVKQAACTALKNLAVGSTDNQTKILEKGGFDALFSAIRTHPNDPLLLVLSFNLMKELCINDEDVAYLIVKSGGIKIILKAMETNRDLATMQVAACGIIGYLLLKGKSEIHAPKLVKAIVTAMKNHTDASDVQIQACDALFELSQVPTTRLILKKKETQELLIRAKSHFKSCESDVDDIIAASNN